MNTIIRQRNRKEPGINYSKIEKQSFIEKMHVLLDLFIVAGAFISAYWIKRSLLPGSLGGLSTLPNYYLMLAQVSVTWLIAEMIFTPNRNFYRQTVFSIIKDLIKMISAVAVLLIITDFMFKIDTSRLLLMLFSGLAFTFLFASKSAILYMYRKHFEKDANRMNVLIIGTKGRAKQVIEHINKNKKHYKIIGCLDTDRELIGSEVIKDIKNIGTIEDIKNITLHNTVDEVIFAMPLKKIDGVDIYILLLEMLGIHVRIIPDWYINSTAFQPGISTVSYDDFRGFPTMLLSANNHNQVNRLFKNVIDISAAAVLLTLLVPFFAITALLIKIFSPHGPVFFKQERMGLSGRKFSICKFRTMVPDAEDRLAELKLMNEADGPAFKISNDPRIIPYIGKFLRKTSLDELPQLLNVLRGEMSLVGPRPPLPAEVEQYDLWQRRRLSMKPGLTCIWQIKPNRNDLSFNEWMSLDLNYIDNWSLGLDFSILARTALVVLGAQGR
ncbi:MAG TPA: sugar transferase [Spirochaetota bacterium]|nr:sugar transferase [Spirochaetota bacterium]